MTAFTTTSPAGGALPDGVTEVGGIVFDFVGVNGVRIVSQTAASDLFTGFFSVNPGPIGARTGFTPSVIDALGGGLQSVAVRLTLFDGDTAPGDFDDEGDNRLLLNGISVGTFSAIATQTTTELGESEATGPTGFGFANGALATGWFDVTDADTLAAIFQSLAPGEVLIALDDDDPFDNFFDFTQGIDGSLSEVGSPPNVIPTPADDVAQTDEDTAVTIDVLANDIDGDGDPLTVTGLTDGTDGTTILNADGTITYTPDGDYSGSDEFSYIVSDSNGGTASARVRVSVAPQNDAPVALADAFESEEDKVALGSVLLNDFDPDQDELTARLLQAPQLGDLSLDPDGTFRFAPPPNADGIFTFAYVVSDGVIDSAPTTATITVTPLNDPPNANDDQFVTQEDQSIEGNILANDSDVDGDELEAELVEGPEHGTLQLEADGSFIYRPDPDFFGQDVFAYRATDEESASAPAIVTLTLRPVDDEPIANDDRAEGMANTAISGDVLANDREPDGDELFAILDEEPTNGSLALETNGMFTYIPDEDFIGTDVFRYRAIAGETASQPATVVLEITPENTAPVGQEDTASGDEDTIITGNVLTNDRDGENDALSAVLRSPPPLGVLELRPDGVFRYTPPANAFGETRFTYEVSDGALTSGPVSVILTVRPVNDAPDANNDRASGIEDGGPIGGSVLGNDTDIDNEALTAKIDTGPKNGQLTLSSDGSFQYTPDPDFNGTDTFTYRASDGSEESDPATVMVTVTPVNDRPAAQDDELAGDEDSKLFGQVFQNDVDVDEDALTARLITGPDFGTLELRPDGTFVYTPDHNYFGPDQFRYAADDGSLVSDTASVRLTVRPVNDAPTGQPEAFATENSSIIGNVLANANDVDGDPLEAQLVEAPRTGKFSFAPSGDFTYNPGIATPRTETFTYQISDGELTSDLLTVTLLINPLNDPPMAMPDQFNVVEDRSVTGNVLGNDLDPEFDPLTAILVANPRDGTIEFNTDGSFMYTPDANFNGTDRFTYKASDGAASSNSATVSLFVAARNDAPVAVADIFFGTEDQSLTGQVGTNDRDIDGDTLTYSLIRPPEHGALTLRSNGQFTYEPDADFAGRDTFTYRAFDGTSDSNAATVTLKLAEVSDDPVATDDRGYSVEAGHTIRFAPSDLIENDGDGDPGYSEPLEIVAVGQALGGEVFINGAGQIVFNADDGVIGTGRFRYTLADDAGNTDTGNVFIEIEPAILYSEVSLDFDFKQNTPSLVYREDGAKAAATALYVGADGTLDDLPISISASDSDDGVRSDYSVDPATVGGLFGPDFVDQVRVTSSGIAIVDGQDYFYGDSAYTIEGDEVLIISLDDTALTGSSASGEISVTGRSGGERVRARLYDDGDLVGTFTSSASKLMVQAPDRQTFDEVRLSAVGAADFTFDAVTFFDVFERPLVEI